MLTTIALIVASATASAETLGRSITGEPVTTDSAVALVFWSMECSDCGARMSDLEEAGVPMIAINTDAANQAAALRAFSARFDLSSPVISDATGDLQRRFQISDGVVILDEASLTTWRRTDTADAITALLGSDTAARIAGH
jgi:alkyl hydroperoxide reductase subunit AhpC